MRRNLILGFMTIALIFVTTNFTYAATPVVSTTNLLWHIDPADPASYPGSGNYLYDLGPSSPDTMTFSTTPTFNSGNGGYLSLSGASSTGKIDSTTSTPIPAKDFTVLMWINPTSITAEQYLFTINRYGATNESVFEISNSKLYYWDFGTSYGFQFTDTCTITANTWMYVGFSRKDNSGTSTGTFYVNGNTCASTTATSIPTSSTHPDLALGRDPRDSSRYFAGGIGPASLYGSALTQAQIQQNMANTLIRNVSLTTSSPIKKLRNVTLTSSLTGFGDGLVTFYYQNRRINRCGSLQTSSKTVSCTWVPIIQGQQTISAKVSLIGTAVESSVFRNFNLVVLKR